MRPRERRETGEQDLFRSRLDHIIDMRHALVKLARTIDWSFLERSFGAVYKDGAGQPPLPTRLMAGLAILKHTYNLSDEAVCELWIENPYYQDNFCGEEFFQHQLPLDRSSMSNWRGRMGEERLQAPIAGEPGGGDQERGDEARRSRPCHRRHDGAAEEHHLPDRCQAVEPGSREAGEAGPEAGCGAAPVLRARRQVHAHQAPALCPCPPVQSRQKGPLRRSSRPILGRVIRDIARKIEGDPWLETKFAQLLSLARQVRDQERGQRGPKVYSLHASRGRVHREGQGAQAPWSSVSR